jgi:ATP-dependent DNA helicase RecQ
MNVRSMLDNAPHRTVSVCVVHAERELDRLVALANVLDQDQRPAIVYAPTARAVDELYGFIACYGGRAVAVARWHGRMRRQDREQSHDRFARGIVRVIVATCTFAGTASELDVRFVVAWGLSRHGLARALDEGRGGMLKVSVR